MYSCGFLAEDLQLLHYETETEPSTLNSLNDFQPLPIEEHGGLPVFYIIGYSSLKWPQISGEINVTNWNSSIHVIDETRDVGQGLRISGSYNKYIISVAAQNALGTAPSPSLMIGHSAEDCGYSFISHA